jgi:hypothetical protein
MRSKSSYGVQVEAAAVARSIREMRVAGAEVVGLAAPTFDR